MPFEVFTKRMKPLTKAPYVTIQKRGTFSLNRSAWAALGEPEALEFMYDAQEKVIGLRAVDPAQEHAYPIRGAKTDGPWIISGTAFARYFDIDINTSRRFNARIDNDILCIDLKDGGTEITSNRSRAPADDAASGKSSPAPGQLV